MADCKSPIVSARSQSLWHNVAIRSVFIIITKRFTHLLFLLPLTILRRRNELELNTNWQVIDATATSKEVDGTNRGSCRWLHISIKGAAMDSFISFSIASQKNGTTILPLSILLHAFN